MTREERMKYLAEQIHIVSQEERDAKAKRDGLKKELFRLIDYDYVHNDHLLPIRTIEVPTDFFEKTGMSYEQFTTSRFPGWTVEHIEKNITEPKIVFILKRNSECMPYSIEIDADGNPYRVVKEINEYTPSVDWETLREELPELYDRLAKPRVEYEIDEDELEKLIHLEPDVLSKLERHMRVKQPVAKVISRRLKDGEGSTQ